MSGTASERTRAFDSIEDAIAAIGRGEIVVVADDEDRENEGDLIMAADLVSEERIAFFVRHTSGVICVGLPGERCDELQLSADGPSERQHRGAGHRVHDLGRSRHRDLDRHLGGGSRARRCAPSPILRSDPPS